jgi:C1A family cysteine protease
MSLIARIVDKFAGTIGWSSEPRSYGWLKDPVDPRDQKYVPSPDVLKALATSVDMRPQDGPIFNQGSLGSCTANGWLGLFMFIHKKQYGDTYVGSRLQLYLDERKLNGNQNSDTGAYVRDGAKCLASIGVCPETMWPYDISKFSQDPPPECYTEAAKNKIVTYLSLTQDINHLKACLTEGHPFVFGFSVAESFENASVTRTGIVPMPQPGEQILGGHCIEALGYVDGDGQVTMFRRRGLLASISHTLRLLTGSRFFSVQPPKNVFICRNSWGTGWGDNGYCYLPFEFMTDSKWCSDFWTVSSVTRETTGPAQ